MKKSLLFIIILLSGVSIYGIIKASDVIMSLEVTAWPISINWSWVITIWTISNNPSETIITWSTSENTFIMKDLRWWPGYYTTIQFDDLKKWNDSISNQNIKFKTINEPNIINWNNNSFIRFWSWIKNILWNIWLPMTYFARIANTNTWEVWRFWDTPTIQITVPANTTWGTYRWTIYYTLIDLE